MTTGQPDQAAGIETRCVNTIRTLAMDAIEKANSGHPGAPMGLAPAGYVLFTRIMRHNPHNPGWSDRDRFVLSGGHASMLLYSLLYLTGYGLELDDIKNFRQWDSKTPGHPEYGLTPGVETTTGPLGQGFANAVGMAMAEAHLGARFNQPDCAIIDHFTYVFCGDGDLMEGVSSEAASLAGHLGLGKLICLYDCNRISIEGSTDIAFTEDVAGRFKAFGWQIIQVEDGNDLESIEKAFQQARSDGDHPSLVVLHTHIAFGSPNKQDSADAHGAPLGREEVRLTKQRLGCDPDAVFSVDPDVLDHFRQAVVRGKALEDAWHDRFLTYKERWPELANQWVDAISGFLPKDWEKQVPVFKPEDGPLATRAASGKVLNRLASSITTLMGGSADLAPSNKTFLEGQAEFQKDSYQGRNIRFGVREHAMAAIMSGMFLHGGIRPYGGTFLVFADYMRPAIRVAALMKLPLIYVFTHDSIAVGEDGPTHQPVEHLAALRAIPNLTVIRPADANETAVAWCQAVASASSPTALILSRQKLQVLDPGLTADKLAKGAYVLEETRDSFQAIIIASGSEVHLALEASRKLKEDGIDTRVVNMPSWELFQQQSEGYRRQVLPPQVKARVVVEAGISMGWERYAGPSGKIICMDGFGASAPGGQVMEKFGFTAGAVADAVRELVG